MSDEQLQALGLPRREFLKKAALGVFVGPVIVSFGLAGTADAAGGCFPNQGYPNQQASTIGSIVITIWTREQQGAIYPSFASQLRKKLLDAEGKLLDGDLKPVCLRLRDVRRSLADEADKKIAGSIASQLDTQIRNLWNNIGCDLCV